MGFWVALEWPVLVRPTELPAPMSPPPLHGAPQRECVRFVNLAVERLLAQLREQPFPGLAKPPSDHHARMLVEGARAWWWSIFDAYGGFIGEAPVSAEINRRGAEDRPVLWYFDPRLHQKPARSPLHPTAEYEFGELPHPFRRLPCPFYDERVVGGRRRGLLDRDRRSLITISVEEWPRVSERLQEGRAEVVEHCERLAAWIRSSRGPVPNPAPTVKLLEEIGRGSVRVRVEHDGAIREEILLGSELGALRNFSRKGTFEMDRGKKSNLLKKLPELRPHLTVTDEVRKSTSGQTATYHMSEQARRRLKLEA